MTPTARVPRPAAVAVLALALAAAVAACSLPTDKAPRAIDKAQIPDLVSPSTVPSTTVAAPGAPVAAVYYVKNGALFAVERRVNQGVDPAAVLRLLLTPLTGSEQDGGLSSFIPPRTRLLGATLGSDGTLLIDLSKEINSISGQNAKTAYAQLVFTATSLPNVQQVRFRTEGVAVAVPTDEGNRSVVDQASYNSPYQVVDGGARPGATSTSTRTN